jgi:D-beta-D-heptose 7-phosphate kinase/D-beta-D-heptose 1-phosphate adenosyltransferase
VVISDYAKGCLSPTLSREIIKRSHEAGRRVIVDPRPQHREFYEGSDYLTPNWKESRTLLHLPDAEPTPDATTAVATRLASTLQANIVLTLGAQGIRFCSKSGDEQFALPTVAREVFDVSGAGDTVAAAFALSVAAGADHMTAVAIANRAASVVVGKFGTATVSAQEILSHGEAPRLVPRHGVASLSATLHGRGQRIVSVVGDFDGIHNGHVHVLNEARKAGDVVVVGLRGDEAVRTSKGQDRPYIPEQQRAELLLALRAVDYVHIVEETDATVFLKELKPHVHVDGSGSSESAETTVVIGAGGRVYSVSRVSVASPTLQSRI